MSLDTALMDVKESISTMSICQSKVDDSREANDVVCLDLQAAGARTFEMNSKADDAHDQIGAHRNRCRRATKEYEAAQEDLNDSLGRLGQLIKDTAFPRCRVAS